MYKKSFPVIVTVCLACLPIATAGAHVVISELLWSGSDLSTADEWIELVNIGSEAVSLSGWTLTRLSGGTEEVMMILPAGAIVGSGSTYLISNFGEAESRLAIEPNFVTSAISLPNTQLLLKLFDASGALVDTIDDGTGAPFAGSNTAPKSSMERIDLAGSGAIKANWRTATTFFNFDDGAPLRGTPGAPNGSGYREDTIPPVEAANFAAEMTSEAKTGTMTTLLITWTPSISLDLASQTLTWSGTGLTLSASATGITANGVGTGMTLLLRSTDHSGNTSTGITTLSRLMPEVRITEVLANPEGTDDEEWMEIGNLGKENVDIGGWVLDDGNSAGTFKIPSPLILLPQEHRVFPKSSTELPLQNSGERVSLMRGQMIMDTWEYFETAEEVSVGRSTIDPSLIESFCTPTPSERNERKEPDPRIVLQSGELMGEVKATVNLTVEMSIGSLAHASCSWEYGDGFTSESCNPPSHTFTQKGVYEIKLHYVNFCHEVIERSITAEVTVGSGMRKSKKPANTSGGGTEPGGEPEEKPMGTCVPTHFTEARLSEVFPNPPGDDAGGEWIELENVESGNTSLCGWMIDDGEDGSSPFSLSNLRIGPKGWLVPPRKLTNIALNNSNESVRLFNPSGTLIDEISYVESKENFSFARGAKGTFAWTMFTTPGVANKFPGRDDSAFLYPVSISAVLPNPEGKDDDQEWIELKNMGASEVHLKGWQLSNSKGKTYIVPKIILLPMGTRRFVSSETRIILTNTKDEVQLLDQNGNLISVLAWSNAKEGKIYTAEDEKENGSGTTLSGATLLSGLEEPEMKYPPPPSNPFSEVMSNPPKEGPLHDLGEYLEFFNQSNEKISLEGWILDDGPGSSKPKTLSEKYTLEPKSYLLLCKGAECDLPLLITLNNDGEELTLTSPNGATVFSVHYPPMERGEIYAWKDSEWCHSETATPKAPNICRTPISSMKKTRGKATASIKSKTLKNPTDVLKKKYRPIFAAEEKMSKEKSSSPLLAALLGNSKISSHRKFDRNSIFTSTLGHLLGTMGFLILGIMGVAYTSQKAHL